MTFTETEIVYALLLGAAILFGLIVAFRKYLSQQSERLSLKYENQDVPTTLKKYPEANIFKFNGMFYRVGLMFSLGIAILAFNWTTFNSVVPMEKIYFENLIENEDVPLVPRETPPPPPPPPVIEEVPEEEMIDDVEFDNMDLDLDESVIADPVEFTEDEPVKPPVIEDEGDDEVIEDAEFVIVEDMPSFPGCENLPTNAERKTCSEEQLMKYIYNNIKYPSLARDNQIEGLVVISFVINKKGEIDKASILKDIGGGCGAEALRVINTMNDMPQNWTPGKQRSQNVNVRFNMPVRFRLQQ